MWRFWSETAPAWRWGGRLESASTPENKKEVEVVEREGIGGEERGWVLRCAVRDSGICSQPIAKLGTPGRLRTPQSPQLRTQSRSIVTYRHARPLSTLYSCACHGLSQWVTALRHRWRGQVVAPPHALSLDALRCAPSSPTTTLSQSSPPRSSPSRCSRLRSPATPLRRA